MDYQIRKLKLYNDILCEKDEDSGNGILRICTATVTEKNFEYVKEDCLSFGSKTENTIIPHGNYLFTQGFLPPDREAFSDDGKPDEELYQAAEQLWLEFLWLEQTPPDTTIYVRLLLHENDYEDKISGQKKSAGTVFQLYRRSTDVE